MEHRYIVIQTSNGFKFCGIGHFNSDGPGKDYIMFEKAFSLTKDNKVSCGLTFNTRIEIGIDDVFWDNYDIVENFVETWFKKLTKSSLF